MTVSEMHTEFKLGYDKADSLNYPNFLPEEIDVFLNRSQDRIINQRAFGNNIKRESLEETQKRVDDLRNIVSDFATTTFTTSSVNKPNGKFVALPSNYRYAIEEEALITYADCNGNNQQERILVIPISHDRYNTMVRDPFNKPDKESILRLALEKQGGFETFELITDGVITLNRYYLRYLRDPQVIRYGTQYPTPTTDQDCELSEHLHREIIDEAVKIALENIQAPRIQTFPSIQSQTE